MWGSLSAGFVAGTLTEELLVVQFYSLEHEGGRAPVHTAAIPRLPPAAAAE